MKKVKKTKQSKIPYSSVESNPEFNTDLPDENDSSTAFELLTPSDTEYFDSLEVDDHISGPELNNNHKKSTSK